jgi:hypothetical protein
MESARIPWEQKKLTVKSCQATMNDMQFHDYTTKTIQMMFDATK